MRKFDWVTTAILAIVTLLAKVSSLSAAEVGAAPDLSYTYRYASEPRPELSIEVRFLGGPAGFTVLGWCLNPWPGLPDCAKSVNGLTVHSQRAGKALAPEQAESNIWTVDHPPGEPLVVRYKVVAHQIPETVSPFAPVVTADSIRFLGDTALVVPEHLLSRPETEIHYTWEGSLPDGWAAASSFAVADRRETVRLPLKTFVRGLFFVGEMSVDEAPGSDGLPLRLVWLKSAPPPAVRQEVLSRLVSIRGAVAGYLGPEMSDARTCFVLPTAAEGVSAMALAESILLLIEPGSVPKDLGGSVTEAITVAHELVHTAPVGSVFLADGPVAANFLPEALAEFIGRRALYRGGLLEEKDWASVVSVKLSRYARKIRTAGAEGVGEADPYVLGDLLVILMDAEIRRVSEGEKGIESFLFDILGKTGNGTPGQRLSWGDFRGSLASLTSSAFVSRLEGLLERRERFELSDDMFDGCLRLTANPVMEFDPGFAVERSIEERRVLGTREGGPAWKAGLRDGTTLLEWSVQWGRADVPVRLVVSRQGEREEMSFLPQGSEVLGVEQKVVPVADGPDCEKVL